MWFLERFIAIPVSLSSIAFLSNIEKTKTHPKVTPYISYRAWGICGKIHQTEKFWAGPWISLKGNTEMNDLKNEMVIRMKTTNEHEILHKTFILISNIKESQNQTNKTQWTLY